MNKTIGITLSGLVLAVLPLTGAEAHLSKCTTAAYVPRTAAGATLLEARGRAYCGHSHATSHGLLVELQERGKKNWRGKYKWHTIARNSDEVPTTKRELYVSALADCKDDGTDNVYRTMIVHGRDGVEGPKYDKPKYSLEVARDC